MCGIILIVNHNSPARPLHATSTITIPTIYPIPHNYHSHNHTHNHCIHHHLSECQASRTICSGTGGTEHRTAQTYLAQARPRTNITKNNSQEPRPGHRTPNSFIDCKSICCGEELFYVRYSHMMTLCTWLLLHWLNCRAYGDMSLAWLELMKRWRRQVKSRC